MAIQLQLRENDVFICKSADFDHDVVDIFLVVAKKAVFIKGFDDFEWKLADEFAELIASKLKIDYIGDVCQEDLKDHW